MNQKPQGKKAGVLRCLAAVLAHFAVLFLLLCVFSAVLAGTEKFERFYMPLSLVSHAAAGVVPAFF